MRGLARIDFIADLALGVIHQNLALSTLNKTNECGHQHN